MVSTVDDDDDNDKASIQSEYALKSWCRSSRRRAARKRETKSLENTCYILQYFFEIKIFILWVYFFFHLLGCYARCNATSPLT